MYIGPGIPSTRLGHDDTALAHHFLGIIAIVLFSELVTSNLYSLLGPLESTAEIMGVSVAVERDRLLTLIVLDAFSELGAVCVILADRGWLAPRPGRIAVLVTAFGLFAYGGYQFWAAEYQLGRQQEWVRLAALETGLIQHHLMQITELIALLSPYVENRIIGNPG